MLDPYKILVRDQLYEDACALSSDAVRAAGAADALDAMKSANAAGRRAEARRLRRAGDTAAFLAGLDDAILDALCDGSIQKMLFDARNAERRRQQLRVVAGGR
ncbi:hypothetical protein [Methylobacterium soli]|uniref:Uncharacterized protein n=1 Tax=Methylobacterium soli TaxID=553447 RepID=A0A6L3T2J1_9HYPH|nr:hypothetical protein [Methylobacterium soli]KAB1079346.1 hypothetical protein F6X53_11090 [Methylobacterium soli]GJE41283.1 hypothetical protein AEGHOMDF_0445 [Methylobacterium soli]